MRLILFFDLPMNTKAEVRIYNKFRKYLIQNGYIMMQFSVYCKLLPNREAAVKHVQILKKNIPVKGYIQIMMITEKQYERIEVLVGNQSHQESVAGSKAFIKL